MTTPSIKEVVGRRFFRLKNEARSFPDLVLIDGGKGQLAAACDALRELSIEHQPIIGLAKRLEEVYLPPRFYADEYSEDIFRAKIIAAYSR